MGAFCRICRDDKNIAKNNVPVFISCNNCGSMACDKHYDFWDTNLNAFCTICFPRQSHQATTQVADLTHSLKEVLSVSENKEIRPVLWSLGSSIENDNVLQGLLGTTRGEVLTKLNTVMTQLASHFEKL